MSKLTWEDLIIQDIAESEAIEWLEPWKPQLDGPCYPVFMSRFGDWFLRRQDGSTIELSVIEGTLERIAESPEQFAAMVNDPTWQEEHLLSFLVHDLYERGMMPFDKQCYGFAPHPTLSGRIDISDVTIFDISTWQSLCADTVQQLKQLD